MGAFLAPGRPAGEIFAPGDLLIFGSGIFTAGETEGTEGPWPSESVSFSTRAAGLRRAPTAGFLEECWFEDSASMLISGAGSAFFFPALLRGSQWFCSL